MSHLAIRLRPVVEADLAMFRRFTTEPGLIGRAGQWRDGYLYSRLRTDPPPPL